MFSLNACAVDDNFYYRSMRYSYCKLARKHRASLLTAHVTAGDAKGRNMARGDEERVGDAVWSRMADLFEVPDPKR
jgi:tRNA uridine 5-carbamoylmethylation protein Kti12